MERTPLERTPAALEAFVGRDDVWLKREDRSELGMFKWRAAGPVVASVVRAGRARVVTSSTGNHGAAVAWACKGEGAQAVVFVPPGAAPARM